MSEVIFTLGQVFAVALAAATGWTLFEMLGCGQRLFSLDRVGPATFWSAYLLVAMAVVVLTAGLAMPA